MQLLPAETRENTDDRRKHDANLGRSRKIDSAPSVSLGRRKCVCSTLCKVSSYVCDCMWPRVRACMCVCRTAGANRCLSSPSSAPWCTCLLSYVHCGFSTRPALRSRPQISFLSHHGGFLFITEKHSTRLIFDAVRVHSRERRSPECVASSSFSTELLFCSCATTTKGVHAPSAPSTQTPRNKRVQGQVRVRNAAYHRLYIMGKFIRVKKTPQATLD